MVIEWMAAKTARVIKEADPERTASKEVLEYGLKIIYNAGTVIVLSLGIGLMTGKFIETIIGMIAFLIMRFITGGYHLKSSDYCVLVSTLMLVIIPHIEPSGLWLIFVNYSTLLLVLIFSPSNIQAQVNFPKRYNMILKFVALLIVIVNIFIFNNVTISASLLIQSLTLIRSDNKL